MNLRPLLLILLATTCVDGATWGQPRRALSSSATAVVTTNHHTTIADALQIPRGGACTDSDPALFVKIGTSAAVEAATMLGTLKLGQYLGEKLEQPKIADLPLTQWISVFAVIFASSFFGSVVDGGLSAATSQVIDPNVTPGDPEWYDSLQKPSWNPPGWVFPIMWLIVSKPTQMVAVSKLFKESSISWGPLAVFCGHLALGDAWNKVFFGLQCTGRGAAVITVFYTALVASVYLFSQVDPIAANFLLPTLGWVTIATCLNWNIYVNNK